MAEAVPDDDVTLPRGLWCISEILERLFLFNDFFRLSGLFPFYFTLFSRNAELFFG